MTPRAHGAAKTIRRVQVAAEDLKKLRTDLRISQRRAATLCGVAANTWARWERGELTPSATARKVIATLPAQVIEKDPERAIPTASVATLLLDCERRDIFIRGRITHVAVQMQELVELHAPRVLINCAIHLLECHPPESAAITSILKLLCPEPAVSLDQQAKRSRGSRGAKKKKKKPK
jgi:DNA-binding transcriptional regulator YiaG